MGRINGFMLPIALALSFHAMATAADIQPDFEVTINRTDSGGTVLFALSNTNDAASRPAIVEVDRTGKVLFKYVQQEGNSWLTDIQKLPSGDYFYCDGANGVRQVDPTGKTLWQWKGPATHSAEILPNGNLLAVSAIDEWAREIDFDGNTVWEWKASDTIRNYDSPETYRNKTARQSTIQNMYALFKEGAVGTTTNPKGDWVHINSAQRLTNGNTLLSLRNLDLVVEVDKQSKPVWVWGALVLKHQHSAQVLGNGNLLVVDNGNSRVIEVDRKTQAIVWEYTDDKLNIPVMGHAQRLPNGNTLITDSYGRRIIEVNRAKEIIWELKVKTTLAPGLYRAKWYE